jgi:hypothetical protein
MRMLEAGFDDRIVYGAITQEKARELVMPQVRRLIAELELERILGWQVLVNEVVTPQGAKLEVIGLKEEDSAEKLRGFNIVLAVLDEVQAYEDSLPNVIDNVITPRLFGTVGFGTLVLMGTPGPVMAGRWFEISTGIEPDWRAFAWTMFDNPHHPGPQHLLDQTLRRKRMTIDDPYIQRELFGRWSADASMLVHPRWEVRPIPGHWRLDDPEWIARELNCTVGIDYGFHPDPSAWTVIAQQRGNDTAYVVHAETCNLSSDPMDSERWSNVTRDLYDHYSPSRIVADYGGGGSQNIALFNAKHGAQIGVHVENAQKSNSTVFKRAQYDSMNEYMRTGRLVLAEGRCDELVEELDSFVWKDERRKETKGADHLSDSLRYGFQAHTAGMSPAQERSPFKRTLVDDERSLQDWVNERARGAMRQASGDDDGFDNSFDEC